jgi:beta-lactamase regulating signal transducer with metallopeptidase domain
MIENTLSKLGMGIALAWIMLPLFARPAAQSRRAHPATYHSALLWALGLGTALFAAPFLHGIVNAAFERWFALPPALSFAPDGVVSTWMAPLVGPSREAWPENPLRRALSALACLWLAGLALDAARLLHALLLLRALCRRAEPVTAAVRRLAEEIAAEHGISMPRLLLSSEVALPFTCGIVRAVVVLPANAPDSPGQELEFMLRHELLHVARRDASVTLGVRVAGAAFTRHPTARRLASEIAFAREASVDAEVAPAAPLHYARFLLAAAERTRSVGPAWLVAVSMADTALARRIDMLVDPIQRSPRSRRTFFSLGAAGLAAAALIGLAPASWGGKSVAVAADAAPAQSSGGHLPREVIQKVVRSHFGAFRACYDKVARPRPETTMDLHFVIGRDGRVRTGHIDSQQVPELGECSTPTMLSLIFPQPKGGEVSVVYPVVLSPEEGETASGSPPPDDTKTGRLPPDVIRSVMRSHVGEFRSCYETLPHPRPALRLKLHFTIGTTGSVDEGHVDSEANPELGRCTEQIMRGIVFPAPEGGVVTVSYPIEFAPN